MWQSDFTHWPLSDGTDTEIISWLDDHSRFLLHTSAHPRITGPIVIDTFTTTMDTYGPPASTLTDNGMVYTTRLARGNTGQRNQPNGFEQLLADLSITQKNGKPAHPTTQGKIERFHRTLADGWAYARCYTSETERRGELDGWLHYYNHHRPHTACGNQPPFSRLINVPGQYI